MPPKPPAPAPSPSKVWLVCALAWAVPGAGHILLGRVGKGLVFLVTLVAMFTTGLLLQGRVFSFDVSDPLVFGEALADVGIGLPYLVVRVLGVGVGNLVAVTFEYGSVFSIVAGLLNMLVVLDAYDLAQDEP